MRIATYTRISTDEEHQPYSLEAQKLRLGSYISSQEDWVLVREFTDQMSGATLERPNLRQALMEAKAGRFDLLLVYRVDRLARSVRGLAQILEELDTAGVAFRSATEPFDTSTPAGRMMVQMLGVFAEFERATIIDRVIAGMERKAARGEWCGGQRPFGYEIDAQTSSLVVNEDEAPLVPVIFRMYGRDRLGARAIANWLNEQHSKTKNGRPWSHMSVLTVLRNRAYVGEIYFRNGHHTASHVTLVERELFDEVQQVLAERSEDHVKRATNSTDYLLSGLLFCDKCGKRFVGTAATGRSARYAYYTCFTRQRYGMKTCDAERLPAEELEEAILRAMNDTYSRTDLVQKAVDRLIATAASERPRYEDELAVLDAEIHKTEVGLDRYLAAFESGDMPADQCGPRVKTLSEKLSKLRAQRERLACEHEQAEDEMPAFNLAGLAEACDAINLVMKNDHNERRKALLQELVHDIRVGDRKDVRPTFRVPTEAVRKVARLAVPTGFEPVYLP